MQPIMRLAALADGKGVGSFGVLAELPANIEGFRNCRDRPFQTPSCAGPEPG